MSLLLTVSEVHPTRLYGGPRVDMHPKTKQKECALKKSMDFQVQYRKSTEAIATLDGSIRFFDGSTPNLDSKTPAFGGGLLKNKLHKSKLLTIKSPMFYGQDSFTA